ncbi:MAG: bifunctional proline dehydrogenase/pyrroline-5-carboxylate dehydrogenase [Acidobacteria bacterium OLB17]|nr:MAG: bifunctional proline dehydrogenase/pyrroline-5-carboxylate dehydrogenase [Acidobacteria bacterium OLB17]MCZ2392113.1 proline dehydrogenase family protein [Acidobacteriota bacterium]
MTEFRLDFRDSETAFADKSDAELKEKYRIFKMLNSPFLNSLGTHATKLGLSIGLPIKGIIKSTIYKQFCGGESIPECDPVIEKLGNSNVGTILDYAIEGKSTEEDFEATKNEIIKTIQRAKGDKNIPFSVFKVTGIAPIGTLEKMSAKKKLDAKAGAKCERIYTRVSEICEAAHNAGQRIFIDAEESWIQDAIDRLATEMMERFNRTKPIVFNTLQMYRTDRLQHLKEARRAAQEAGYVYAVKLVRGAYMEKERERAEEMGYPSPIHATKKETDADYNAALEYCMKHYDDLAFVTASHNVKSTRKVTEAMYEANVEPGHPHIFFSQLYGMGDNISYVLAKNGYNVSKYVPYGPVAETVPYLIRRAEENSSAAGHMSRELELISEEIKRRGI